MQTDGPTLQSFLENKYGVNDCIIAEGRFVSFVEDHAASLVCLGLSSENLVIADIVFRGTGMDYDIQYYISLSALSLSYLRDHQIIEIRSEYRDTITCELCSCTNQREVWEMFTSTIDKLNQEETEDSLKDFSDTKIISTLCPTETECLSRFSYIENDSSIASDSSQQNLIVTESSVSLPTKLPSETRSRHIISKSHSSGCLNVEFDDFINDDYNSNTEDDKVNYMYDISLNNTSDVSLNDDAENDSGSKIMKFICWFFPCCSINK